MLLPSHIVNVADPRLVSPWMNAESEPRQERLLSLIILKYLDLDPSPAFFRNCTARSCPRAGPLSVS